MTEKLNYLSRLKNNMGEEMAEMMSEEITKVMDEQRDLEKTYAKLITERGELKGISNKHKLHQTKQQILVSLPFNREYISNRHLMCMQTVAKDLKESTRKLCRQLQDNPDVEGNQREIRKHKNDLIERNSEVMDELQSELKFENFARRIEEDLAKQSEFERLREEEK